MYSFLKSISSTLNKLVLNGNIKTLRITITVQLIFIPLFNFNCSSLLYTTGDKEENLFNLQNKTSCGKSIEFISDTYRDFDLTFPIKKQAARNYIVNKIPLIEEYFSKNSNVLKKDTIKISIEYQSDSRVIVYYLHQVKDSNIVINDINRIVHSSHSLDSAFMLSVCVDLSVVKINNTANAYINDVNYSTVIRRSKANIMKAIVKIAPEMRYEYNRILRKYRGIRGKLSLKFTIDETGKVIYLKVIESSLNNCEMENNAVNIIKGCFFEATGNKPNITTVIYPFIFSP